MATYIEYHPFAKKTDYGFDLELLQNEFLHIMQKYGQRINIKPQVKKMTVIRKDNLVYTYDLNTKDQKAFSLNFIDCEFDKGCKLMFKKEKKPNHLFPSSNKVNDMFYINKLVFKIHHKVYVNFEQQINVDKSVLFKVFINYNWEERLDEENIYKLLNQTIMNLTS
jgi:hypothetical protein